MAQTKRQTCYLIAEFHVTPDEEIEGYLGQCGISPQVAAKRNPAAFLDFAARVAAEARRLEARREAEQLGLFENDDENDSTESKL